MKTIVCGADFSAVSMEACRLAVRIAQRWGDRCVMVHAVDVSAAPGLPEIAGYAPVLSDEIFKAQEERLKEAVEGLQKEGFAVEGCVRFGAATQVLQDVVSEHNTRLVVLGSHGRTGAERWLLGSTSERAVQSLHAPVLVVKQDSSGLLDWLQGKRPLRVVVGLDHTSATEASVQWLRELTVLEKVDITCVHVYFPPHEYVRLGLGGQRSMFEPDTEVVGVLRRELMDRIGGFPAASSVRWDVRPHWGRISDAFDHNIHDAHADVLLVGSHQRGFAARLWHGSVAQNVLEHASVPALCVPVTAAHAGEVKPVKKLQRILVATDLSPASQKAVAEAYSLLRSSGGVVDVCYVLDNHVPLSGYGYEKKTPSLSAEQRRELEILIRKSIPQEASHYGILTNILIIEQGRPADAILAAADRLLVDCVCVSSHGRSGFRQAVLGSVAQDVLNRSNHPVFVSRIRQE
jgi:nucleotide-binding universal stress UspA family protein